MNLAIETEGLGKRYGDVAAVEDLSLRVAEGEIYAFLGLNGAGKTTTIRMLLGMIKPTSGLARVLGATGAPGQPGTVGRGRLPGGDAAQLSRADRAREPGGGAAPASRHAAGCRQPLDRTAGACGIRRPARGHALAGQRAAAGAGQGPAARAPAAPAGRAGQRPGSGRDRRDPRTAAGAHAGSRA